MATTLFPVAFDHATREREIYAAWEAVDAFRADPNSAKPPFLIPMPPPNANGPLHLGHAMTFSIEDLLVRWRRMSGYEVLWLPGTDHASLATESHVMNQLRQQGLEDPRGYLGCDGLVKHIEDYVEKSRLEIRRQIKALGASCDWSRERYTRDSHMTRIVNEIFGRMFHDGLIYRGSRVVHWDVLLQTTLADDEVIKKEVEGNRYTIKYDRFLVTTDAPEMCLADTALAIHPQNLRKEWLECVDQVYEVTWPHGPTTRVRMIEDSAAVRNVGIGIVGVAPAHSISDFEIGKRHGLPILSIINENGLMSDAAGPYKGMTRMECRKAFVQHLRASNLLLSEVPHREKVHVTRSGGPVEHLLKSQWFIDVNRPVIHWEGKMLSLRQVMADVVSSKQIRFIPEYQEKSYSNWVDDLRDWCISRQTCWGHRVPVWYRNQCETYVGTRPPGGDGWSQDPDTLDTWFSSALWSWSTLLDETATADTSLTLEQILERSAAYHRFHPAAVLETGYDVLLFWVARMILMTTYATKQVPFRTAYLHGIVRDKHRRKLSPSKPEAVIKLESLMTNYGTDALRLALILSNTDSTTLWREEELKSASKFVRKLWNAARYVAQNGSFGAAREDVAHPVNRWMLARLNDAIGNTTQALESFEFKNAAGALRDSFRRDFCDFYIEVTKTPSLEQLPETRQTLGHALVIYLHLLHPFMPFVTEELWRITGHTKFLMQRPWPTPEMLAGDEPRGVDVLMETIDAVHGWRSTEKLKWRVPLELAIWVGNGGDGVDFIAPILEKVLNARTVRFVGQETACNLPVSERLQIGVRIADESAG